MPNTILDFLSPSYYAVVTVIVISAFGFVYFRELRENQKKSDPGDVNERHSNFDPDKEEEEIDRDGLDEAYGPDASNYVRAQTPSDAVGGMAPEEVSRPAHARYSFDGAGEGELPISAGAELEVLDDRDPSWWYARDVQTGQEGVVPAAFLY